MKPIKTTAVEPEDASDAGFVSRWSRLKHEAVEDVEATASENLTGANAVADKGELEPGHESPARILTDEDMPDVESLTQESDYADFLSPGVSDELRKLALRKLFLSEVFNIRDGLDEYDEDYTQFEKLGDIVTSDMKHQLELEAQRKAQQILHDEEAAVLDGECSNGAGENSIDKESADENLVAADNADKTSVQLDESRSLAEEETGNGAEDDAPCGQKAILKNEKQS
jgi:hypothetical protein